MDSEQVLAVWRTTKESKGWDEPAEVFQSTTKRSWFLLLTDDGEIAAVVDVYTECVLDAEEFSLAAIERMKWKKLRARAKVAV